MTLPSSEERADLVRRLRSRDYDWGDITDAADLIEVLDAALIERDEWSVRAILRLAAAHARLSEGERQ